MKQEQRNKKPTKSAFLGAAFLMATSAIGPGFLTQTSRFTQDLLTSFGFVILISVLLDIGAQLNIWRTIGYSNKKAPEITNALFPGLGLFLSLLIGFGGMVFNIGNISGTGLGLNALTGMDTRWGALLSAGLALAIFWIPRSAKVMDWLVKILGIAMILLTIYVAFSSSPPVGQALAHSLFPEITSAFIIVTLVGGTVGGYISFAGAHRLVDAGITGADNIERINRSAVSGIVITSFMRYVLFLAVLGVVYKGVVLDPGNPAASAFRHATGELGYRFFGFVMWSAAITSVVGASYTSVSFFRGLHPLFDQHSKILVSIFIIVSAVIFMFNANPVALLLLAGAVNGLILPIALAIILLSAGRPAITGNLPRPLWLVAGGWLVVIVMGWMGIKILSENLPLLW